MKKRLQNGLSMASILVLVFSVLIVGVVLVAMAAVLDSYESSTVRSAQTSSRQAVDQVANTVSSYVDDMHGVMDLLERTLEDSTVDRDGFFQAFLSIRPDVVAVTTYDPSGSRAPGDGGGESVLRPRDGPGERHLPAPCGFHF